MSIDNNKESGEKEKKTSDIFSAMPQALKLRAAVLFFINELPEKLDRIKLCKHLFYADGHYFQKYSKPITELPYLHVEGSPQPVFFNEIFHLMLAKGEIEVVPNIEKENSSEGRPLVMKGFVYKTSILFEDLFSRDEKKVLKSIASLLKGSMMLETRYFPNLYQNYVQTPLYETIYFKELPAGKRPHLLWKAWAKKVFRLLGE
ncbi:MAG: Panacea domain-containing protein [Spirochaetia bacterium]|nr:Panacea domain-containing protein [Spirochaetia bacterium]